MLEGKGYFWLVRLNTKKGTLEGGWKLLDIPVKWWYKIPQAPSYQDMSFVNSWL